MTPLEKRVLTIVSRIPPGRVTTYGDVARMAGKPGAARAVGNILREASRPGLPYHRVIGAGGVLGGYSSLPLKRSLLAADGLAVSARRVVGFSSVRWPASPQEMGNGQTAPRRPGKNGRRMRAVK